MWPWKTPTEPETTKPAPEERGYSDAILNALLDAASTPEADSYVSALETAAGQLSRAFTSARITGTGAAAFGPWVLAQIGRQLVEAGESIWIRVGMRLIRGDNYDILPGGRYQFSLPTGVQIQPPERVLHVRWNVDVASGRGIGPLTTARTLRNLMLRLERSLATESNASVGYLLPVPSDGNDATIQKLKSDLASLDGRIAVAETTRGGWGDSSSSAPRRDFELSRLGPNYPDSSVALFREARFAVLNACGYPVSLSALEDGTGQREAWRRYLHGTVSPLGRLVEEEASRIGLPIDIDFESLFASDIQGRARAFQSLVTGGMAVEAAAAASGLLTPQDD